jgi:hypothetical protein
MFRPHVLFLIGLSGTLLLASGGGCHGSDTLPQCGDFAACGGGTGTGGDAGSDAATTFPCKGLACQIGKEACTVTSHFNENEMGACTPLPAACAMPGATCDCFGTVDPACMCEQQPSGDFAVFCNYNK